MQAASQTSRALQFEPWWPLKGKRGRAEREGESVKTTEALLSAVLRHIRRSNRYATDEHFSQGLKPALKLGRSLNSKVVLQGQEKENTAQGKLNLHCSAISAELAKSHLTIGHIHAETQGGIGLR